MAMRDFGSLILGKYCTFVCGILFKWIKLIKFWPKKKVHIQKCDTYRVFEIRGRTFDLTLGSSADTNLRHNHIII